MSIKKIFAAHWQNLVVVLFLVAGFLLRWLPVGEVTVGFDQVQILEEANKIARGDFTFIGPRTGPATMFTGPLIYYLSALLVMVAGDWVTLALMPSLLAVVTGAVLFLLARIYLGRRSSWWLVALWAFSPLLIQLDKVFWNPDLTLLACVLVSVPLFGGRTRIDKYKKLTAFCLFAGAFLGYQAHFSGLLLVFLGAVALIYLRRAKYLWWLGIGLVVSLSPTLIFDYQHEWLNARGLVEFATRGSNFSIGGFLIDVAKNAKIILELIGALLLRGTSGETCVVAGALLVGLSVVYGARAKGISRAQLRIIYGWLIAVAILFALYDGEKPEYYFIIIFVPAMILIANLLQKLPRRWLIVVSVFLLCNAALTNARFYTVQNGFTVNNLQALYEKLRGEEISEIVYDTEYGADYGVRYFLSQIPLSELGEAVHVIYPNTYSWAGVETVGDLGVWRDDHSVLHNYIVRDKYTLRTPRAYFLYQNLLLTPDEAPYDEYVLVFENQVIGKVRVAQWNGSDDDIHPSWFDNCRVDAGEESTCGRSQLISHWYQVELSEDYQGPFVEIEIK